MSKVEDLAKELYPDWEMTGVSTVDGQEESMVRIQRVAYIKGYHQAEKDLDLTWEDMMLIHKCIKDAMNHHLYKMMEGMEGQKIVYQEVLKRFKNLKNEPIKFKQGDVLYIAKHNIWVVWDEYNDTVINFMDFKLFIGHRFDSSITVEDVHVTSEQQRLQLIQMLRDKMQMYIGRNSITDEIESALKTIEK